jgi:hypothetical protein
MTTQSQVGRAGSAEHTVRRRAAGSGWVLAAALATGGAGALHVAAAVDHAAASDLVVGFFLLTAFAQFGIGTWLLLGTWLGRRPGIEPVALALAGTVVLVGLYLLAHTTGLFTGLLAHDAGSGHTGHGVAIEGPVSLAGGPSSAPEPADLLGATTVALELLSVLALTALLPRTWRGRTLNALLVLGGVAWAAWLTGVLG